MLALGCLVGTKFMDREKSYPWVGKLQFVAIIVLIFTMGIRIGADERVIASLKEIGMYSLVLKYTFCSTIFIVSKIFM